MAVPNTIPPHLRHITVPEREDRTPGLLQRVGGLLQRGIQAYGGLFAGDADPAATEAQNRQARQRALLAAASALAGQRGFEAVPRAALVGREVADETRQGLIGRAQERERQERLEGLLSGGIEDEGTVRGLLGEAIRTGDVGSAQVLRGLLTDMQPGTPLVIRDGADTVLLDPQTRQEIQRFAGEQEVDRVDLGDRIAGIDPQTGQELFSLRKSQRTTPAQARAERQEQQQEQVARASELAGLLVQFGHWGEEGPDVGTIAAQIRGNFPQLDRTAVGDIARQAINQRAEFEAAQRGRELMNQVREKDLADSGPQLDPAAVSDIIRSYRGSGLTDEQIIQTVTARFGPDAANVFRAQMGGGAAGVEFGQFGDLVNR